MKQQDWAPEALTIIGTGRVGSSIAAAATEAGIDTALLGRDFEPSSLTDHYVLLCVPDEAIEDVCALIIESGCRPAMIGHTSGVTTLKPLAAVATVSGCFSIHALQTVPDRSTELKGAPAAVTGSTGPSEDYAEAMAARLGMDPFRVAELDRSVYHAAASIASNFLITLEQSAADLLERIDVENPRAVLAPLVCRTVENWIEQGAEALTGPIARGDETTVEKHRAALAGTRPDLLRLYDLMAEQTRSLGSDRVTGDSA